MNLQLVTFLIACFVAAVFAPSLGAQRSPADEAELTGTVVAPNGAFVNGASLLFTSGDRKIPIRTGNAGSYTIRLAPGIYTVSVESSGFCRLRRSAFSLKSGAHAKLDFGLSVCSSDWGGRESGEYGEEELKAIGPAGLRPLVMYGERQEAPESITYTPLILRLLQHTDLPVVYTYDLLTIKCDHLIYFPKDNSIEASGNVVWQDGSETRRGSKLSLSFRDGEPIVSLTP
jgi:hypothetical protein